jgi:hypothetical protein
MTRAMSTGTPLTRASVARMDPRSHFRRTVERCAVIRARVYHNGFIWRIEGGPACLDIGALDLSAVTSSDLNPRGKHHGSK